jgi:hypothetical protein
MTVQIVFSVPLGQSSCQTEGSVTAGQRALGKLTPVEFELAFTTQAAAVAA